MLSTYSKLKDAVQRGGALLGATVLLAGLAVTAFPAYVFADALNPLTERSLTLSSSSPGWSYLDGSGNTTYAPPHSGANGQKTGNTFSFRMSSFSGDSTTTVKAITFQYCTTPAGDCTAPGDNGFGVGSGTITLNDTDVAVAGVGTDFLEELTVGAKIVTAGDNEYIVADIQDATNLTLTTPATETESGVTFGYSNADTESTSDLNVVESNSAMIDSGDWATIAASPTKTPNRNGDDGNFVLLHADADTVMSTPLPDWGDYDYAAGADWEMTATNVETGTVQAGTATGKFNFITITSDTGEDLSDELGDYFKIIFFGTDDNYVTNPGSGAFFVRMNTYSDVAMTELLDGGVTVANVMNESITIQTKVLETMAFSVGTHDPNLYTVSDLQDTPGGSLSTFAHGQCSTLLMRDPHSASYATDPNNVIRLGNQSNEFSLETGRAWDGFSYWRLSSNSSGGATVYYTGHTLTNTVGDEIMPLDETPTASVIGTEQFGLGIATDTDDSILGSLGVGETWPVWEGDDTLYSSYGTFDDDGDGDFSTFLDHYLLIAGGDTVDDNDIFAHYPRLYPLVPMAPYGDHDGDLDGSAAGSINDADGLTLADQGSGPVANTAKFAFNANADTYAQPIATESDQVVNCVTAKMRYIANIAATTPAGIYTTKINYVASPQY